MNLTKALKEWLVANAGVKSDASDDTFRKAAGEAMASGKLSGEKYFELAKDPGAAQASEFLTVQKQTNELLLKLLEKQSGTTTTATPEGDKAAAEAAAKAAAEAETKAKAEAETKAKAEAEAKAKAEAEKSGKPEWYTKMLSNFSGDGGGTGPDVRVKGAWEQYSDTKGGVKKYPEAVTTKGGKEKRHVLAGQPMEDFGRTLHEPSDRAKACAGVWAKWQILSSKGNMGGRLALEHLTQHEKELFYYMLEHEEFDDSKDNKIGQRKLTVREQKALIDDSTSGGTEAAPIVFDDMIIEVPLLYGELFPLVNTIPLDRGRRIEGVATGTVTGSWGGVDDTAIALFNTNSYVSAFDTTVFRWQGSIRLGLDFLSDTPIDFAQHVTRQYGERLLEDLDDVVAAGNGTTQPEGIINKSGATSVSFGSATTIGNYESLRFGVAKKEHSANVKPTAVFCGTETSYQRVMALPVGASDARRLFGEGQVGGTNSYDDYSIMKRPYKINESLTNLQIFYAVLARYRMYRRRGLYVRTSTEGDTLIRANEMLIVVMARYGGQMERGGAVAKTTDAPS